MTDNKKNRRRNIEDIIRDEIYGAGIYGSGSLVDGDMLVIPIKEIKKIAKRIVRRTSIGPAP